VNDIKPLNWIQKLSHYCRMSLGFQIFYAGRSWCYIVTSELPCADCSAQWALVAGHAQWTSMASRTAYITWNTQKPTLFDGHYLSNRPTLDIGVLGCIVIFWHKEHSPEVVTLTRGTACIYRDARSRKQRGSVFLLLETWGGNVASGGGWGGGRYECCVTGY
jgi:hypothetical protein